MIVVKVELWPGGREERKREIGRMTLANDCRTTITDPNRGSYNVKLMRRGTTDKVQKTTRVEDYPRKSYPVWELVRRALDRLYEK